jgi:AcrR family transcriptional regulator
MSAKNPDLTRSKLLEAGFEEVHEHGFRAASLESILARAGVTKGALYHHFPNKQALGYALVEEVIGDFMADRLLAPLQSTDDPVTALQRQGLEMVDEHAQEACSVGCPLNNLAQEMSFEDEGFRRRIEAVIERLQRGVAASLRRGQEAGTVRRDIDPDAIAAFWLAASSGIMGAAKSSRDPRVMRSLVETGNAFLETLRPLPVH